MPQLPSILHRLHCWLFLPSSQSVASLYPTFSTNVGWCVGVQPTSYALEMSVVCFRTYKRTLLLWTVPFPGFNLGGGHWKSMSRKKKTKKIDKTVRIYLSLVFWPLRIPKGQYSLLVGCASWVQWNGMTKHINSRMRFVDAFIDNSTSLFHASRF